SGRSSSPLATMAAVSRAGQSGGALTQPSRVDGLVLWSSKQLGTALMQPTFDRAAEDLGNSIHLEHVNVQIPDQRLAMLFYVSGLGLTRDPYLMVHDGNMWINAGRSQFHLPTGPAQVLRG